MFIYHYVDFLILIFFIFTTLIMIISYYIGQIVRGTGKISNNHMFIKKNNNNTAYFARDSLIKIVKLHIINFYIVKNISFVWKILKIINWYGWLNYVFILLFIEMKKYIMLWKFDILFPFLIDMEDYILILLYINVVSFLIQLM